MFAQGVTDAQQLVGMVWADRYAGVVDEGWEALRDGILARQMEVGVLPTDAVLNR